MVLRFMGLMVLLFSPLSAMELASMKVIHNEQPKNTEWQNEQWWQQNKMPTPANFAPFADAESARAILPDKSDRVIPLDGKWKFHWVKHPDERPSNFYKPEYDVSGWQEISVPSSWQLAGYDVPIYANQPYIFKKDWPRVMTEPPESYTMFKNRNPVGSYRREMEIPANWDGKKIIIKFDGVDSFFYLWVNGNYVGFSQDSRSPAMFDITRYVEAGKRNIVAAEVYRLSDGSYLECQDMWRLSGIFRSVYLLARPQTYLYDIFAVPSKGENNQWKLKINGEIDGDANDHQVALKLFAEDGKIVAEQKITANEFKNANELMVDDPQLWSAEIPNCYTLIAELQNKENATLEAISLLTGFRAITIENRVFKINGQPVKLRGVNRHENFPESGHAITRAQTELDFRRLKEANVNHVRNSHYPTDDYFYYLCNKYGMYLVDEANIESHGYGYGKESLSHPKEWESAHVDRVMAMVERNKNHPCVVIWSLGNEAGPGNNFVVAEKTLKRRDTSRPTHYERNNDIVDIGSNQYPSIEWTENAALGKSDKIKYPFYISEYAHIMNNGMGNFADYWNAIDSSDFIMGGGIWEWCDQGLYKTTADGKKYVAYGGDFGDVPNDGLFIVKGVVYADRAPKPCFWEVKKVHQEITAETVKDADGGFTEFVKIFNKHYFRTLNDLEIYWTLTCNGERIQDGKMPCPPVAPRTSEEIKVPFIESVKLSAGKEYHLNLGFRRITAEKWLPAGHEIACEQLGLFRVSRPQATWDKNATPPTVEKAGKNHVVKAGKTTATFGYANAGLLSLKFGDREIFTAPPTLQAFRCPINNDIWCVRAWFENGLHNLKHTVTNLKIDESQKECVRVMVEVNSIGEKAKIGEVVTNPVHGGTAAASIGDIAGWKIFPQNEPAKLHFSQTWIWTISADGNVTVQVVIDPLGDDSIVLGRIGINFRLPKNASEKTAWFGRGPFENYPDRKAAALVGYYQKPTAEFFEQYAKPQEMASFEDVRWAALTDKDGNGIAISPTSPLSMSFLGFTALELFNAPHPFELPPLGDTDVNLSARVLGLGGASCGPRPMARDIIRSDMAYSLSVTFRPLNAGENLANIAAPLPPLVEPVTVTRQKGGNLILDCATFNSQIEYSIDVGKTWEKYETPLAVGEIPALRTRATAKDLMPTPTLTTLLQKIEHQAMRVIFASSEYAEGGEGSNLVDGDNYTFWHTNYGLTLAKHPHWFVVELDKEKSLKGVILTPRQDIDNGRIKDYQVEISTDNENWQTVAEGALPDEQQPQTINFKEPKPTRFVRFTAKSEQQGRDFATACEFKVIVE